MNPVFFGSRDRQLFGVHTAAAGGATRAAVICPPLGLEYQRTHRALRILAERLAGAGVSTLRFDYFGTGDSLGEPEDISIDGCAGDARTAAEELCALAGARRVTMIGVRLGAAIAARAVAGMRGQMESLVLWDPVVDGARHAADVRNPADPLRRYRPAPLPARLEADVRSIDAPTYEVRARRVLVIASAPTPDFEALRARLDGKAGIDYVIQPSSSSWVEEADLGVGAVPVPLIERIVAWAGRP